MFEAVKVVNPDTHFSLSDIDDFFQLQLLELFNNLSSNLITKQKYCIMQYRVTNLLYSIQV